MAGISKGAFYLYFPSKNVLIASLLADYIKGLDLDYENIYNAFPQDTTASEILLALAEKIAENISCSIGPNLMSLAYEVQLTKEVDTNFLMGYSRKLYNIFNEILAKGIKQGEFNPGISAKTIASHCVLAIRGLTFEWCIRYPNFNLVEQTRVHFELLLNGIKNRK